MACYHTNHAGKRKGQQREIPRMQNYTTTRSEKDRRILHCNFLTTCLLLIIFVSNIGKRILQIVGLYQHNFWCYTLHVSNSMFSMIEVAKHRSDNKAH